MTTHHTRSARAGSHARTATARRRRCRHEQRCRGAQRVDAVDVFDFGMTAATSARPLADARVAIVTTAPAQFGQAALDIRAYYEEAALALAGHVPAARQAESWFYRATATGGLLREAQRLLRDAEAPRPAWFPLVPVGQPLA